jgi:hypothetical protein
MGSIHVDMVLFQTGIGEDGLQIRRVTENALDKQSRAGYK